jgi:hypothetical protein
MNQKITLLTNPPFPIVYTSNLRFRLGNYFNYLISTIIKKELPMGKTGPETVLSNLYKGLLLSNFEVFYNPPVFAVSSLVGVLSDINTLDWAIKAKQKNKISKLIAGPNLVILPSDNNSIICSDMIDIVVTPCEWVSKLYCSMDSSLQHKIREWPVGVDSNYWTPSSGNIRNKWIIYDKSNEEDKEIVNHVESHLISKGINYYKIVYGKYKPEDYKNLLDTAVAMIVITASESQGLAQFEAWSCNIPTLIWDRGFWINLDKGIKWKGASSSPYFSELCGEKFSGVNDFINTLDEFIYKLNSYHPRDYILSNFTLEICAKKYTDLFK